MKEELQFPCNFVEVLEWGDLLSEEAEPKTKSGRYTSTVLPVKGYGTNVWSVVAYISVDRDALHGDYTDEQIVEGCINFLNKKPPRKRKAPYGVLKLDNFTFVENKKLFSVRLLIDSRNHKSFWGKGWTNS